MRKGRRLPQDVLTLTSHTTNSKNPTDDSLQAPAGSAHDDAVILNQHGGQQAYWKLALRVAYYGRQGQRGSKDLEFALRRWDGDDSWQIGCEIQIQVSRSKRLLPSPAQQKLDQAQQEVVDYLDHEIDRLRDAGTPDDWEKLHASLMREKRTDIDSLLKSVTADLKIGGTPRQIRTRLAHPKPLDPRS
jgi:hypothetical protein